MTAFPNEPAMTTLHTDTDNPTKAGITNIATLVASGCGTGLSPIAPGTVGSVFAVACLAGTLEVSLSWHWWSWLFAVLLAVWSAGRAGESWGVIDHPAIVIDEVVGVWLALLIPMTVLTFTLPSGLLLLGTLALFRVFDIVKPWPVDVLERRIPGGWGVVLDDLAAGLMAGGCMTLLLMAVTTP